MKHYVGKLAEIVIVKNMNFQLIIVFVIIAIAAGYFGLNIWRKSKTFTKKSGGCGSDCGCDAKK